MLSDDHLAAIKRVTQETLSTLKCGETDRSWVSDNLIRNMKNMSNREFLNKLASFAVLSNNNIFTGHYSRLYNITLLDIISRRNSSRFDNLIDLPFEESFPELYQNMELTDRKTPQGFVDIEFEAALLSIKNYIILGRDRYKVSIFTPGVGLVSYNESIRNGKQRTVTSLYDRNMDKICTGEGTIGAPSPEIKIKQKGNIECYNFDTIMFRFAREEYTKPSSGQPFPSETIDIIRSKYFLEISLTRAFLEKKYQTNETVVESVSETTVSSEKDITPISSTRTNTRSPTRKRVVTYR